MLYPLSYEGLTAGSLPVEVPRPIPAVISFGNFDKTFLERVRRALIRQ